MHQAPLSSHRLSKLEGVLRKGPPINWNCCNTQLQKVAMFSQNPVSIFPVGALSVTWQYQYYPAQVPSIQWLNHLLFNCPGPFHQEELVTLATGTTERKAWVGTCVRRLPGKTQASFGSTQPVSEDGPSPLVGEKTASNNWVISVTQEQSPSPTVMLSTQTLILFKKTFSWFLVNISLDRKSDKYRKSQRIKFQWFNFFHQWRLLVFPCLMVSSKCVWFSTYHMTLNIPNTEKIVKELCMHITPIGRMLTPHWLHFFINKTDPSNTYCILSLSVKNQTISFELA